MIQINNKNYDLNYWI